MNYQRAGYLLLHLADNALNYYLRLSESTRNDLDGSLDQLRNRCAGADQRSNFELDLPSRKFDPVKEQPGVFLTHLHSLANQTIFDYHAAHKDRTDERTRTKSEQFIQGMPCEYKKVLLKESDDLTVKELYAIFKTQIRIDQTAFNTLISSCIPELAK